MAKKRKSLPASPSGSSPQKSEARRRFEAQEWENPASRARNRGMDNGNAKHVLPVPLSDVIGVDWEAQKLFGKEDLANAYDLIKAECPELLSLVTDDG